MRSHTISATEANRSFSELLNRVYYQGLTFEVKRGREIIAKISPCTTSSKHTIKVRELNVFLETIPKLDPEDSKEFEKELIKHRKSKKAEKNKWD